MFKKLGIGGLLLLLILLFNLLPAYAAELVSCSAVLEGRVAAADLVRAGQSVTAGQVLVNVETLSGLTPSVLSPIDGVVREVLIRPGQNIVSGEVVLKIEGRN